jgi:hypothetical protein
MALGGIDIRSGLKESTVKLRMIPNIDDTTYNPEHSKTPFIAAIKTKAADD